MKSRRWIATSFALGAMAASVFSSGSATADLRAQGLEEVALVEVPRPSHFDWFEREIDGETRVIAMIGSLSLDPKLPQVDPGLTIVDDRPAGGLNLVDVTDPTAPEFLLNVYCPTDNNDVAYVDAAHTIADVAYDGFITIASNDETGCVRQNGLERGAVSVIGLRAEALPGETLSATWLRSPFVDAAAPARRFSWSVGTLGPAAHTVVAHPVKPIVYVGNQQLGDRDPSVEILDFSVWPPTGYSHPIGIPVNETRTIPTALAAGPHDITFSPDGTRAYVSAIDASYIWDTTGDKVRAPELLAPLLSPNLKIHHETVLHPNGRHLLTIDEFVASSDNSPVCPGGGVHIFDTGPLSEDGTRAFERAPVPVGQFYADELGTIVPFRVEAGHDGSEPVATVDLSISCTAHEFNIAPDGTWMPLGWFGAGTRLLDLSSLTSPEVVDAPIPTPVTIAEIGFHVPDGADVWAAKQHPSLPGYVFVSDTANGFRILKLSGVPEQI